MGDQDFTKQKRLLHSQEFDTVFKNKDYRISTAEFLILAKHNSEAQSRIGMVIGKKSVKFAVSRNKVKRAIRESFRRNYHSESNLDIVVVARPGVNKILKNGLFTGLNRIWMDLSRKASDKALIVNSHV